MKLSSAYNVTATDPKLLPDFADLKEPTVIPSKDPELLPDFADV